MATITGTQNADTLEGTSGDDTIDGRRAADTLIGMEGNDLYIFDRVDDVAVETETGGNDTVRIAFANTGAAVNIDMRASNFGNIEGLEFSRSGLFDAIGNDLDNTITGNAAVNHLSGGAGNDTLDGRGGADVLDGGEGDDTFYVDEAGDMVEDTGGWDTVYAKLSWVLGTGIEKLVLTGSGNFSGTGNALDNYIAGNSGANTLSGGGGYDQLAGGAGNDTYIVISNEGGNYSSIIEEADGGVDTVRASTIIYTLDANVEKLVLTEEAGDASGYGNDLSNVITGNSHDNTLSGGAGVDTLEGGAGDDTYHSDIMSDGTSVVIEDKVKELSGQGDDTLVLHGYIAMPGASTLTLSNNFENLDVSDTGATRLDLIGNNASNAITGNSADNIINGKKGDDLLSGGDGNDTYRFAQGDGVDAIDDISGADKVIFTSSGIKPLNTTYTQISYDLVIHYGTQGDVLRIVNFFSGGDTVEQVAFANGTVHDAAFISANLVPYAGEGNDYVIGTSQGDVLEGLQGNDTLLGMGGDDILYGGEGDDTIDGGEGGDLIVGSEGNDTYIFAQNSGEDRLVDDGGASTLLFGAGISVASVSYFYAENGGLNISYGSGNALHVEGFQYDPNKIGQLVFNDGTIHDANFILSHMAAPLLTLTEDSDYFADSGVPLNISGLGGDDMIYTGESSDTINGGTGNDALYGASGNDIYLFAEGDGADQIEDTYGDETVSMAAGIDPASATYTRLNYDLIIGYGAAGDNVTFKYFFDQYSIADRVVFADGTIHDIGYINAHLVPALITLTDGDDTYYGDSWDEHVDGLGGNDYILVGAGNNTVSGGEGDDFIASDEGNDTISGGAGNDTLHGWQGDDLYVFAVGDGADIVWDFDGADIISFTEGVGPEDVVYSRTFGDLVISYGSGDTVTVQYFFSDFQLKIEAVSFADGTVHDAGYIQGHLANGGLVSLSEEGDVYHSGQGSVAVAGLGGNDVIYGHGDENILMGGAGDDQLFSFGVSNELTGGTGNDTLYGGENDIYLFSKGDGIDRIEDALGNDTIRFGGDVDAATVFYTQDGSDLIVHYGGTGSEIRVSSHFAGNDYQVEQVIFDDGTVHDAAYISENIYTYPVGTDGDDILIGNAEDNYIDAYGGNDTVEGRGGSDVIAGYDGDDTLAGGAGNDNIYGDAGNDKYVFSLGDGNDVIYDYDGSDQIVFAEGVAASTVSYARSYDDLLIAYGSGTDTIRVSGYFLDSALEIENISFTTGENHDASYILSHLAGNGALLLTVNNDGYNGTEGSDNIWALAGDDAVNSGAGDDTVDGGDGNDHLFGNTGNDTLLGGAGDDTLWGAEDDDTYLLELGHGADTIADWGGQDIIRFGDGISSVDLDFLREGSDLVIHYGTGGDQVRIMSYYYDPSQRIEQIAFYGEAGSSIEDVIASQYSPLTGTEGDDVLTGTPGKDRIDGLGGDDIIDGGSGIDALYGGEGNDTLVIDSAADTAVGGDGIDTLVAAFDTSGGISLGSYADIENIILTGNIGGSAFGSNDVDNYMRGSDGNGNWLYAGSGNDTLESGGGTADLMGGAGDDTYYVHHFGDWALEQVDSGYDVLYADVSYTSFGSSIEEFVLLGTGDINAVVEACGNAVTISGTIGSNTLIGSYGSDIITGFDGDDVLGGHYAADTLTGGAGDDTFIFDQNAFYGMDTITDFSNADDMIDISQLLVDAYDPLTMSIADFVLAEEIGGNTVLSVDADGAGTGSSMIQISNLSGATGLGSAEDMIANGQLIVGV